MEDVGGSINIPLSKGTETVVVRSSDFQQENSEILDVLCDELPPLSIWTQCAVMYYKFHKYDKFIELLNKAQEKEIPKRAPTFDRAVFHTCIASYKLLLAQNEPDPQLRKGLIEDAKKHSTTAFELDYNDPFVSSTKGLVRLQVREVEYASKHFDTASRRDPKNIPAQLGKAAICYHEGKYKEAFEIYKNVALSHPSPTSGIFIGLGLCHLQVGNHINARLCFLRALKVDPDDVNAHTGLGYVELQLKSKGFYGSAVGHFQCAYESTPSNAVALNQLANHIFYRALLQSDPSLLETSCALATNALASTESHKIEAQSLYIIGRCYHRQEKFEDALKCYNKSSKCWPEYVLPKFGEGQLLLHLGQKEHAREIFEMLLQRNSSDYDVMRMLGVIYSSMPDKRHEAIRHFTAFTKAYPEESDVLVELAELQETSDPKAALKAYEKALEVKRSLKEHVPYQLLNNIGTMHFVVGKHKKYHTRIEELTRNTKHVESTDSRHPSRHFASALSYFDEAMNTTGLGPFEGENVTLQFNKGRVYEELHEDHLAIEIYDEILRHHPSYTDCLLRKALMEKKKRKFEAALQTCQKAVEANHKVDTGIVAKGYIQLECEDFKNASRTFKSVREKFDRSDPYTLVAFGNLTYGTAHGPEKPKIFKEAFNHYSSAFKANPKNIYAANGIGLIYAEQGNLEQAKEIFQLLRRTSDVSDFTINLAHIHVIQGYPDIAIQMYQSVVSKQSDFGDLSLMCYLGRAYFDAKKYAEAEKIVIKMLHIKPGHLQFSYNLATIQTKYANQLLDGEKTLDIGRKITRLINSAIRIYGRLLEIKNTQGLYEHAQVKEEKKACEKIVKHTVDKFMKAAQDEEFAMNRQKQEAKEFMEMALMQKKMEEEERIRNEELRREREAAIASKLMKELEEERIRQELNKPDPPKKKSQKNKGNHDGSGDDDDSYEGKGHRRSESKEHEETMYRSGSDQENEENPEEGDDPSEESAKLTDDEERDGGEVKEDTHQSRKDMDRKEKKKRSKKEKKSKHSEKEQSKHNKDSHKSKEKRQKRKEEKRKDKSKSESSTSMKNDLRGLVRKKLKESDDPSEQKSDEEEHQGSTAEDNPTYDSSEGRSANGHSEKASDNGDSEAETAPRRKKIRSMGSEGEESEMEDLELDN